MKARSLVGVLCLISSALVLGQEVLTNSSIEKMVKAGLGDSVIVAMIQNQPGQYDVTPDTLIALKAQGISDKLLSAMTAKGSQVPAQATPSVGDRYEDLDLGVYHKVRDTWVIVASEPVNWKTGGVLKSIATDGIVKGDVNGRLRGSSGATQMNTPLEFLIKAPDGVEAADFKLVHLHEKSDAREFRTVTGGVFHASGGSLRDAVRFEQVKSRSTPTKSLCLPIFPQASMHSWLLGLQVLPRVGLLGRHIPFA
jgi:hypothetical protein